MGRKALGSALSSIEDMKQIRKDKSTISSEKPCIWEQAGISSREACQESYQCGRCEYDREMSKVASNNSRIRAEGKETKGENRHVVFWREKLQELPLGKRPCQHFLKRQIAFRNCTNDYQCQNCSFDQYFYDQYAVHTVIKPIDVLDIEGLKAPQGYYYHRGHCWVKLEENSEVRIGLDDFAYHLLGQPDRIEVPLIGKELTHDRAEIHLVRGDHTANLLSPVSGIVTAINVQLREEAAPAYNEPYSDGWLMRVHVPGLRENLKRLMMGEEVQELLEKQVDGLFQIIEQDVQPLAADGGNLQRDVFGALPEIGWERLIQTFFT